MYVRYGKCDGYHRHKCFPEHDNVERNCIVDWDDRHDFHYVYQLPERRRFHDERKHSLDCDWVAEHDLTKSVDGRWFEHNWNQSEHDYAEHDDSFYQHAN